ncbi:hypothetical protein TNCV_806231 [Trichonephila clavipes]|nr:hypothetical protein TNCV_806231 [Trichonephila clavipes]
MVHQHIFRLRCVTISLLHISRSRLDAAGLFPGPQSLGFSLLEDLKFVYEMPEAKVEDLMARIFFTSADIPSILDLFERIRQSVARWCRLCYDLCGHNF